jgi:release factor glutamine methyltransferase
MNVSELLEGAAARLRSAGVPKPRREAHRLWAWINRVSPGEAYLFRDRARIPESRVLEEFDAMVARRVGGEPLAYVLGHIGFRNLELRCDRRALIPRPESEGLIEHALRRMPGGHRALDLGTGTGCLALALADEGRFDRIVAADVSREALRLAAENAAATGHQLALVQGEFGAALAGHFDLIVANPPYLTEAEYAGLDGSVRDWEPRLALASGADGLEATRQVLRDASRLLAARGWLVMELDSSRSALVAALAGDAGFHEVGVWEDLFGRARYLTARQAGE